MTRPISWLLRGTPWNELAKDPTTMWGTPAASSLLVRRTRKAPAPCSFMARARARSARLGEKDHRRAECAAKPSRLVFAVLGMPRTDACACQLPRGIRQISGDTGPGIRAHAPVGLELSLVNLERRVVRPHSTTIPPARTREERPSLGLVDVEAADLSRRGQVETKIGAEVAPLVRVKRTGDFEPAVNDVINRREALVAERVLGEPGQTARAAVVEQLRAILELSRPPRAVA